MASNDLFLKGTWSRSAAVPARADMIVRHAPGRRSRP
jgi:hypothetical protein